MHHFNFEDNIIVKRFYDSMNNRLVYVDNKANSQFWDTHWDDYEIMQMIKSAVLNRMVLVPTRKYLPIGSRILEGGCGLGQNVWSLQQAGYDVYGVDYAIETVEKVNDAVPELKVSLGDVRQMKFENDFFDGYWSLGVIEHFYQGYDDIAYEMRRVIKPGGYLFLTFPCMSKYRRMKNARGKYEIWEARKDLISNFYQFALSVENVVKDFIKHGFKLVESKSVAGLKGFKDELSIYCIKKCLQKLYDSNLFINRVMAWGIDYLLSPFSGHSQLLIFKNLE